VAGARGKTEFFWYTHSSWVQTLAAKWGCQHTSFSKRVGNRAGLESATKSSNT
jgi:hypothetical protein